MSPQVTLQVLHRAAEAAQLGGQVAPRLAEGPGAGSAAARLRLPAPRAARAEGGAGRSPRGPRAAGRGRFGVALGGAPPATVVAWCCRGRKRGGESRSVAATPPPTPALPTAAPRPSHLEPEASFPGPSPTCKENQEKLVPPRTPSRFALQARHCWCPRKEETRGGAVRLKERKGRGEERTRATVRWASLCHRKGKERSRHLLRDLEG